MLEFQPVDGEGRDKMEGAHAGGQKEERRVGRVEVSQHELNTWRFKLSEHVVMKLPRRHMFQTAFLIYFVFRLRKLEGAYQAQLIEARTALKEVKKENKKNIAAVATASLQAQKGKSCHVVCLHTCFSAVKLSPRVF